MNKLILIGNLTRDPELRYTPQQTPVCNFTVAVNERNSDGEQTAQYFRVTTWRQLAENCSKYLAKGRKVYASGPVKAQTYQANDGSTRVSLEVTASEVEFLSPQADQKPSQAQKTAPAGFMPVDAGDDLPF